MKHQKHKRKSGIGPPRPGPALTVGQRVHFRYGGGDKPWEAGTVLGLGLSRSGDVLVEDAVGRKLWIPVRPTRLQVDRIGLSDA